MTLRALKLSDLAAFGILLAAAVYAWVKPIWDWDFMAYLFLAKQVLGVDYVSAHAWLYGEVVPLFDPTQQELLLHWERFREVMAADPEALRQVGAFYHERVGYYGFLAVLMGLGVGPLGAIKGVFVTAQAVLGSVAWAWLRRVYDAKWALLGLVVVMFFPTVLKVARWSSPDGVVAASYVLGLYAFVYGQKDWQRGVWVAAWLVMVACKPNSAMLVAPLGLWAIWQKDWAAVGGLLLVGAVAGLLHVAFPAYGLALLWQHSWGAGPFPYPQVIADTGMYRLSLGRWWEVFSLRMGNLHGRDLLIFGLMWVSLAVVWWKGQPKRTWLATALVAGVLGQVLAYPGFWERLYMGPVLGIVLLALETYAVSVKSRDKIVNRGALP